MFIGSLPLLTAAPVYSFRSNFFTNFITLLVLGLVCLPASAEMKGEWSGNISFDARIFAEDAAYSGQDDHNGSVAFEPEYYLDWNDGQQRLVFAPFVRYDANDDERTHADLRELYWRGTYGDVELKVGAVRVFWGVTESQHLVDVINQVDLIENIDTEDRLGQPMINANFIRDWGTVELYVLPYFRERTFAGEEGRLRNELLVDIDDPEYESGAEEWHTDFAIRWSHYIGDWDIGIAHFSGTGRDPLFMPVVKSGGRIELQPYYEQIDQTSLDLQATKGDWLWKLEALTRRGEDGRYSAAVGGFEYTLVGIADSASDLGILLEYHFDDRGDDATNPFQNDTFLGLRWVLNDIQSTELLMGAVVDMDNQASFYNLEASRRLGESWKLTVEARIFANPSDEDPLFDLADDDYLEIQLAWYF